MDGIIFESAVLFNFKNKQTSNGTPFESVIEVAAVQSGTHLYDSIQQKSFDYSNSNLAKGILFSKLYAPNSVTLSENREAFWQSVHEGAQALQKDICIVRDIRAGFALNMAKEQMIEIAENVAQEEFISKGYNVDVNIHLHRKEIPHCHFLIPTFDISQKRELEHFIDDSYVAHIKKIWGGKLSIDNVRNCDYD